MIAILFSLWAGWQLNNNIRAMRASQQNLRRIETEEQRDRLERLLDK